MNSTRKNNKFLRLFDFFIYNLKIKLKAQNLNPLDTNTNYDEEWYSTKTNEKDFLLINENIFSQINFTSDLELSEGFYELLDNNKEYSQNTSSDIYIMY